MKSNFLSRIILVSVIFCQIFTFSTAHAQGLTTRIDSILTAQFKANEPGAVFLVTAQGKVIYRKAFGLANLELNVPMKPEQVFEIGSITKQFTAVAILMLLEQGKLYLQDEITKYLPDYPTGGKTITIHHLLTHTSGIKSYTSMKALRDIARTDLSPIELIDFFKNEPVDFDPGEQYKYNNSGYVILGHIIELLSEQTYEDFITEHIFKPLNMSSSLYGSHRKIVKNRAYGYQKNDDFVNTMYISLTLPYAGGSLMANVDDMLLWQEAITKNTLVKQKTINLAFTNYTLNNSEKINYGYGWGIRKVDNLTIRQHGGSIFGYKSMGVHIPSEDIYVIGMTNCDCNSPTQITKDIAQLVLKSQ